MFCLEMFALAHLKFAPKFSQVVGRLVLEALQADSLSTQFAAHTTKCCLPILQASFAPAFRHCNRPVPSVNCSELCIALARAEMCQKPFHQLDAKWKQAHIWVVWGHLHQNMSIINAHIHSEPEQVPPPLLSATRNVVILPHLVASVDAAHVVVVECNNRKRGYFDEGAVSLLSSHCVISNNLALSAEESNIFFVFPNWGDDVSFAAKNRFSATECFHGGSVGFQISREIFAICTRRSTQV